MIRSLTGWAALALLVSGSQAGPVGGPIAIAPDSALPFIATAANLHGIAYGEGCDRYLSLHSRVASNPDQASYGNEDLDLYGNLIDPVTGSIGSPLALETSLCDAHSPAAAWNSSMRRFLVVFVRQGYDPTTGEDLLPNIFGLILDENGAAVGGAAPFPLSSTSRPPSPSPWYLANGDWDTAACRIPRVASDGRGWLVVWQYDGFSAGFGIEGRLVDGASTNDGPALAGGILSIQADQIACANPAVAFGAGADYLVTWFGTRMPVDPAASTMVHGILGRTVSPGGTMGPEPTGASFYHIPPVNSSGFPGYKSVPVVAADPLSREFLIAWDERLSATGPDIDVWVRRILADGSPAAPATPVAQDPARIARTPAVAWNPNANQYLIGWLEAPAGSTTYDAKYTRLNGPDAQILAPSAAIAGSLKIRGLFAASRSGHDSQAVLQWIGEIVDPDPISWNGTPVAPFPLKAQRIDLGSNPNAPLVSGAGQFRADGTTPIAAGGTAIETSFVLQARMSQVQSRPIRLEAEIRESGLPFGGTATASGSQVANGGVASVVVTGLVRGKSYHWQIRGVDSAGNTGEWNSNQADQSGVDLRIRGNALPTPVAVQQYKSNGAVVPVGRDTSLDSMSIQVLAADADGDEVRIEVELRPLGTRFGGTATASGSFAPAGSSSPVEITGLADRSYHWRFRLIDSAQEAGSWISFGGNPEEEADFVVPQLGSLSSSTCLQAVGVDPGMLAALVVLAMIGRRRQ